MKLSLEDIVEGIKEYRDREIISASDYNNLDLVMDTLKKVKPLRKVVKQHNLTEKQKLDLIEYFRECYYDTAQDTEEFAAEYYNVVGHISSNEVPIKLKYLTDFIEGVVDIVPEIQEYLEKNE